jgi:hypothetical protein
VKGRGLAAGWIVMVLVVLAGLGWTVAQTISFRRSGATADAQGVGLARELEASRQNIQAELVANADLLRDIRWSPDRATAADVLRRLADLARGSQANVVAIAPLEQEPAARYRKASHRVDMAASFRELVDFATRVEREGGILEDVVLEILQGKPGDETGRDAVRAQFRLTTIEPSEDTRRIMERVLTASTKGSKSVLAAALTLPIEGRAQATLTPLRDPFRFAEAPRRREPARLAAPAPASAPVSVKGIVKFPGGAFAIVNDQIVKVGDVVDGQRVKEIADGRVVLSEPGGGSRSALLPGFVAAPTTRR